MEKNIQNRKEKLSRIMKDIDKLGRIVYNYLEQFNISDVANPFWPLRHAIERDGANTNRHSSALLISMRNAAEYMDNCHVGPKYPKYLFSEEFSCASRLVNEVIELLPKESVFCIQLTSIREAFAAVSAYIVLSEQMPVESTEKQIYNRAAHMLATRVWRTLERLTNELKDGPALRTTQETSSEVLS